MQTRREYAISLGLAKPTRGRMSSAAKEAIAKAEAGGKRFSDSPRENLVSGEVISDKPKESPEDLFGPTPEKRFDGGWFVYEDSKKVKVGGAEVCRTCMCSLDYHLCNNPIIPSWNGEMISVLR